jgi:hypothetical protein
MGPIIIKLASRPLPGVKITFFINNPHDTQWVLTGYFQGIMGKKQQQSLQKKYP